MKLKLNLLIFLLVLAAGLAPAQETKVKMQFGVFAEDGSFFADLKASDIRLRRNKTDLQAVLLEAKTKIPLEIVFMIDASISQERTLPDEKKAAKYFIDNVLKKDLDKVAVVRFTGEFSFEQVLTDDFAKAKQQIEKIEFIPPAGYVGGGIIAGLPKPKSADMKTGSTSIWDSIRQVAEITAKTPATDSRRVIIMISDGFNTFGEADLREAVNASVKNRIPVYALGIGDEFYGGVDKKTLKKLAERTNGVSIVPKDDLKDLPEQMKKFEHALRSVYEVTFAAASASSMQELEIEIINPELRKQKLQIVQPKGFFVQN